MIDLRSDTVTTPTPEMLRAMTAAEVGDDVYGEDPSLNRLEEEVAALLGKEAAVFTPSGSMANQIAILLHTRPGDSVLCEESSHTFAYEAGAGAALSGVQFDLIPFSENLSDEAIKGRFRPDGLHESTSTLILVENTHNRGRGRALPRQETQRIVNTAHGLGLKAHCDGARLWNAAVATGHSERDLAAGFDTVSVCFSKGLGAPVGSALAGSREDVGRARKIRKRLGGGMRQAGFLAAAALYGVRQHRGRLVEDHRRAVALAEGLKEIVHDGRPLEVDIPDPPTNMVYWRVADGGDVVARLRDKGVLVNHVGGGWIRSVTHLQISYSDSDVHKAIRRIREVLLASGDRG